MTTIGDAMVTLLTDNWAGAGATPTIAHLVDYPKDLADTDEQVIVRLPIHDDADPINDILSNFKYTMQIRVKSTVSDDRLKVLADETIRIINTYAITGITRQFAKRGEDTSDRKRQIFSRDIWASLEEHASTAGTAYSSPGAGDVVFPADVNIIVGNLGVGIAASADYETYFSNDGTKPQLALRDAAGGVIWRFKETTGTMTIDPVSGTNRTVAFSNSGAADVNVTIDGTLGVTGVTTFSDESITSTQIADLLMFGSANAAWVPVAFDGWTGQHPDVGNPGHRTFDATNPTWQFVLGRPTAKGSLKLYINGVRIVVTDADGAAYVDQTRVMGSTDAAFTSVYTDGTNADSAAVWESGSGFGAWGAATDMSSYGAVRVYLNIVSAGLGRLDISSIQLSCYYA